MAAEVVSCWGMVQQTLRLDEPSGSTRVAPLFMEKCATRKHLLLSWEMCPGDPRCTLHAESCFFQATVKSHPLRDGTQQATTPGMGKERCPRAARVKVSWLEDAASRDMGTGYSDTQL